MLGLQRRHSSVFDVNFELQRRKDVRRKRLTLSGRQLHIGIIIGVLLTVITIILQCTAFFTPHWKEISPNTHSLYVDGVDALIRTEVLVYFNSVHRFTHLSYGLFQRCEYVSNNPSKLINERKEFTDTDIKKNRKKCTNNFLPSFENDQFNECHSLQYYRFCSKSNGKVFDIDNDYLRATFDITSTSPFHIPSEFSCDCRYPTYVKVCHILGIFALVFLFLTALLFASFPFLQNRDQRLTVKCFGVLSSLLAIIFIFINLMTVLNYLQYESIAYLNAIERHYKLSEIYKLSHDTRLAIDRFISSINIRVGYSTILAWIAFVLSIIDGILLLLTCKIADDFHEKKRIFTGVSSETSQLNSNSRNEDNSASNGRHSLTQVSIDSQTTPILPTIEISKCDGEQSKTQSLTPASCLKRPPVPKTRVEESS
jgi:hypothetical protein